MECTSCGENCPFVKAKLCSSEKDCPNYLESWWQENGQGQPKVIKDCAPKRLLLQQQTEVNRIFALQQSIEEMRNRFLLLESSLIQLIAQSQEYISQEIKLLDTPKKTSKHKAELTQLSQKRKKSENDRGLHISQQNANAG